MIGWASLPLGAMREVRFSGRAVLISWSMTVGECFSMSWTEGWASSKIGS